MRYSFSSGEGKSKAVLQNASRIRNLEKSSLTHKTRLMEKEIVVIEVSLAQVKTLINFLWKYKPTKIAKFRKNMNNYPSLIKNEKKFI